MVISYEERNRIFGEPGKGSYVDYTTPWGISVKIHSLILDVYKEACEEAKDVAWKPKRIDSFNVRPIRDQKVASLHGYGLACDYFVTGPGIPPPGGVWHPVNPVSDEFAECFTKRGFRWGRNFSNRQDWPHIEWPNGLLDTTTPAPPVLSTQGEENMLANDPISGGVWALKPDGAVITQNAPYCGGLNTPGMQSKQGVHPGQNGHFVGIAYFKLPSGVDGYVLGFQFDNQANPSFYNIDRGVDGQDGNWLKDQKALG